MDEIESKLSNLGSILDLTDIRKAQESVRDSEYRLRSIFDSINEPIYVSDLDTYKVLWVNDYMIRLIGHNPVGKTCYSEFQGKNAPCTFCTNPIIRKVGEYSWRHHNQSFGRDYQVTDKVVTWSDGKDVRLEIAIDITSLVQQQKYQKASAEIARILGGLA